MLESAVDLKIDKIAIWISCLYADKKFGVKFQKCIYICHLYWYFAH